MTMAMLSGAIACMSMAPLRPAAGISMAPLELIMVLASHAFSPPVAVMWRVSSSCADGLAPSKATGANFGSAAGAGAAAGAAGGVAGGAIGAAGAAGAAAGLFAGCAGACADCARAMVVQARATGMNERILRCFMMGPKRCRSDVLKCKCDWKR